MTKSEALNPIRALKSTFETMNLQPGHLWGGAILLIFVEQLIGVGFQFIEPVAMSLGEESVGFLLCGSCVAALGFLLLATWLMAGLYLTFGSVLQTGETGEGGLFDHQGKFFPLLLTKLLVGVCSILLMIPGILLMVGAIALGIGISEASGPLGVVVIFLGALAGYAVLFYCIAGLLFAESAVIFDRFTPFEAVKHSWGLASGVRWRIVLFFFVNAIFSMLGLLMCCVGVLATSAVARLATAEAYLNFAAAEPNPRRPLRSPSAAEQSSSTESP